MLLIKANYCSPGEESQTKDQIRKTNTRKDGGSRDSCDNTDNNALWEIYDTLRRGFGNHSGCIRFLPKFQSFVFFKRWKLVKKNWRLFKYEDSNTKVTFSSSQESSGFFLKKSLKDKKPRKKLLILITVL